MRRRLRCGRGSWPVLAGGSCPAFKVPDRIEFVAHFPHTGVGKVSRKDLRERLRQAWLQRAAS